MRPGITHDLAHSKDSAATLAIDRLNLGLPARRPRARLLALDFEGRDRLLRQVMQSYRTEDTRLWASVLLDLIAPAILARLVRFTATPPVITSEDISQQLLAEVLIAAATMPLPDNARFVERRLMLRAGQAVSRWLRREHRRQSSQEPAELVFADAAAGRAEE